MLNKFLVTTALSVLSVASVSCANKANSPTQSAQSTQDDKTKYEYLNASVDQAGIKSSSIKLEGVVDCTTIKNKAPFTIDPASKLEKISIMSKGRCEVALSSLKLDSKNLIPVSVLRHNFEDGKLSPTFTPYPTSFMDESTQDLYQVALSQKSDNSLIWQITLVSGVREEYGGDENIHDAALKTQISEVMNEEILITYRIHKDRKTGMGHVWYAYVNVPKAFTTVAYSDSPTLKITDEIHSPGFDSHLVKLKLSDTPRYAHLISVSPFNKEPIVKTIKIKGLKEMQNSPRFSNMEYFNNHPERGIYVKPHRIDLYGVNLNLLEVKRVYLAQPLTLLGDFGNSIVTEYYLTHPESSTYSIEFPKCVTFMVTGAETNIPLPIKLVPKAPVYKNYKSGQPSIKDVNLTIPFYDPVTYKDCKGEIAQRKLALEFSASFDGDIKGYTKLTNNPGASVDPQSANIRILGIRPNTNK